MPKVKVRSITVPEDLPIWDELVATLGDPRPYEPTVITASYVVPDDAFTAETLEYEAAYAEVDREVDDLMSDLDDVARDAQEVLDAVMPLDEAQTVVDAHLANETTQVIHLWPVADVEMTHDTGNGENENEETR